MMPSLCLGGMPAFATNYVCLGAHLVLLLLYFSSQMNLKQASRRAYLLFARIRGYKSGP